MHLECRDGFRLNASQPIVWLPLDPSTSGESLKIYVGGFIVCHSECRMRLVFIGKGPEMLNVLERVGKRIVLPQMPS